MRSRHRRKPAHRSKPDNRHPQGRDLHTRRRARRALLARGVLPALARSGWNAEIAATIERELAPVSERPVPLPRNCADGLFGAYWARPELYLDGAVRRNISQFALTPESEVAEGLARLERDLASGAWDRRFGRLRTLPDVDFGHRLIVSEACRQG
ncbi:MAG: hypothetical protein HOQ28_20180 [Thermoleophilia bacterium]|nr:hypothetical protein [Thermoleophilia bacterium]